MRLNGKVAVITGAGSGIGHATALKFAREGAKVVVADLDLDAARSVVAEIEAAGVPGDAVALEVDVSSWEQMQRLLAGSAEAFGAVHVMFNNAGIGGGQPLLEHEPEKHYHPMIRIDQDGVYFGILAAARQFVKQGTPGVIINSSSIYGETVAANTFSYSAAKAAVISMTRSAAMDLAAHDIRVVAIAPGRVMTPMMKTLRISQARLDFMASEQLRGRWTQPEEIADVVAFLASDEANVINGTLVNVEDGYTVFKTRVQE
jgi:NAD(P)-dependent dehydrogenase (short-subunit alcohol dehydrogenase family)